MHISAGLAVFFTAATSLCTLPAAMQVRRAEALAEKRTKIEVDCHNWFGSIIECASPGPTWIATGSFGQAWLAKEKRSGREVVLKIFYTTKTKPAKYLTSRDVLELNDTDVQVQVEQAREECDLAKEIQEGPDTRYYTDVRHEDKGRRRIMGCFGHNLDAGPDDPTPLYLMLENCGPDTLLTYYRRHMGDGTWNTQTMMLIVKQILEGLEFLQSFTATYMHHDLRPENIAIKEVPDRVTGKMVPLVYLIDLGAMRRCKKGDRDNERLACAFSVSTPHYAPREWRRPLLGIENCDKGAFDPNHPDAFDMHAVAAMLLEMTFPMGGRMPEVIQTYISNTGEDADEALAAAKQVWIKRNDLLRHEIIWGRAAESPYFISSLVEIWLMEEEKLPGWQKHMLNEIKNDASLESFYDDVKQCLAVSASERSVASHLLKASYMRHLPETPVDVAAVPNRPGRHSLHARTRSLFWRA